MKRTILQFLPKTATTVANTHLLIVFKKCSLET